MTRKPVQVLLVEDNPGDARLIRECLTNAGDAGFKIEAAYTLQNALEWCSRSGIDVVLLDLGLPDSVGFDTLKTFRSRVPALPVVVLTGLADEKIAVQAGAQDYLIKGEISGALMARALRYAIERKRAEEKMKQQLDELRRWQEVTLGREGRIAELKLEVNESLARVGEKSKYGKTESGG
jgi:DNA-binding response OmpR family regulator